MKRFIECVIPITFCNIKCSYCYLIQQNRRGKDIPDFTFSPEHIGNALSKERLGGISFVSITGSGETFVPKEVPDVVFNILKQGHFVNLTTNGTITKRIQQLLSKCKEQTSRINISFSLHYDELIEKKLLNTFFQNVKMVKDAGCSILIQINLSDEYVPLWEDIKEKVLSATGALPQVALTRTGGPQNFKILTKMSDEEYIKIGKEMNSPLFDFTVKNFMVKRNEFCYAGDWSAKLDLTTGEMSGCYGHGVSQNIFKDLSKPIKFEPIGKTCPFRYCFNSSHFLALGTIPSLETPSYGSLRNRAEGAWYSKEMQKFLDGRLYEDNLEYNSLQQLYFTNKNKLRLIIKRVENKIKRTLKSNG